MTEEREHLQKLIELHRANLQHYEELEAKYGLDCPVYVKNAKEEARKGLAEARAKLAALEGRAPDAEPSIPAIPQNLPPRGEFIGREREMEQVRQALASRSYLVVIEGIGGIGKTVLALEVAHELWEKGLYEAVVWTTARDRALDLNDILDTFARTIDYPYIAQLPPEEKPTEATKLMRSKKCLLLVDNFETIKDETVSGFLLNLPEPSKALITTRHHALGEARTIPLKGMEQGEALALTRAEGERLGLESVQRAGDEILLRLYEATGGAPLAIKWAVGQIKQKGQSLDSVLDSLYGARGDLFEFMFSRSWEMLSEDARHILMVMPIFATSASKEAIEAASDVRTWDLDEGLGQLVEMSLVEVSGGLEEQQRYSVHPLVRAFARGELEKNAQFEKEVWLRSADYFLDFAKQHGGEDWRGYRILNNEWENLAGIIDWCFNAKKWKMVIEFRSTLCDFLSTYGYWSERIKLAKQAVTACERTGDREQLAWCMVYDLGYINERMGNLDEAWKWISKGRRIFEELGERRGLAFSLRSLGVILRKRGLSASAKQLLERSLSIFEDVDDRINAGRVKMDIGRLYYWEGNYSTAKIWMEEALASCKQLDDQRVLARALCHLGDIACEQDENNRAKQLFERSLEICEMIGFQNRTATCIHGLAKVKEKVGEYSEALMQVHEAMEIYRRLGQKPEFEKVREMMERLERAVAEGSTADEKQ
jgi:tetratricopeptide (TPR) repeat protein